eukprot:TRINITY_DN10575_c0_g1_i1.p1 TRINITY_DN10575_c0_g1~~TRINITY_DN10575_c0_g1_i1.p1  ORF type:complete len:291 (+),score=19.01 TRINITY_DN10575_c0_g1_i1:171-1043(+)
MWYYLKYKLYTLACYGLFFLDALMRSIHHIKRKFSIFKSNPLMSSSKLVQIPWYSFDRDKNNWIPQSYVEKSKSLISESESRELRIATFNILTNEFSFVDEIVCNAYRFAYINKQILPNLDADVICLNEVTNEYLPLLLTQEWVRRNYYISSLDIASKGNLILSKRDKCKRLFIERFDESLSHRARPAVVAECSAGAGVDLAIASVHLTAVIYNSHFRKIELERLHSAIEATFSQSTSRLIIGDMNMHSETENNIIPSGYRDVWKELHKSIETGITVRDPPALPVTLFLA